MLGRLNPDIKEATVIGAGYAGLISAYRLLKAGYQVTVHEASNRTGGLISTSETPYGIVESAAHSIRSSPEIENLIRELNISIIESHSKTKFILRSGRLRKNPLTLWEMFTAGCYAGFKKSDGRHLTLAEWGAAHIGQGGVDNALTPISHGIYAAEPEELDQQLAFPTMTLPEGETLVSKLFKKKAPSNKPCVMAPEAGMQALTDSLSNFIINHQKGEIIFNSRIDTLPNAANLIVATPANIAGQLIGSNRLANLRYAPMVTTTVFVKKSDIDTLKGIGFLNARGDDQNYLGILFNSSTFRFKNPDYVSLTVMMGGTRHPEVLEKSDKDIETIIASELKRLLGFKGEWISTHITRWPNAIPLYSKELRETLEELKNGWCAAPGRILAGNYAGEVSIRGMCATSLELTRQ